MLSTEEAPDKLLMVFNRVFIQMYFTPEEIFLNVLYDFYQVLIRELHGSSLSDAGKWPTHKTSMRCPSAFWKKHDRCRCRPSWYIREGRKQE